MESNNNCPSRARREFLLKTMTLASALPLVLAAQTFSRSAKAQGKADHVDPKDPMAKSLNFTLNGSKADAKKFPNRAKTSFCWNCNFYTAQPDGTEADKSKEGKCTIFQGKIVPEKGWCSTWAENAKYKGKKHA